jgi:hypothetical protein
MDCAEFKINCADVFSPNTKDESQLALIAVESSRFSGLEMESRNRDNKNCQTFRSKIYSVIFVTYNFGMRYFFYLFLLVFTASFGQEKRETNAVDVTYFTGNILPHTDDLSHLITGHPQGVMVNFLRQTHGDKEWQKVYGFPDYGAYFLYQDYGNAILGEVYAVGAHYNFYSWKRRLVFKISQGIAFANNPHDKETNSKNNAFGSAIIANTNFAFTYKKENVVDKVGFQAGILFTHFSNGRIKAPNSGINSYGINVGLNYNFDKQEARKLDTVAVDLTLKEPLHYNFVLRTGVNESPVINSGQHPFYHLGFYVDKRLGRKSALQLGTEIFISEFYKDFIKFQTIAYPEQGLDPNTDYKRVGIFVGHELFINRISLEAQLGYYVYQPYKFDIPVYDRLGMKYYFSKNMFTGLSIKTHIFLAEAMEFVVGVRF